MLKRLDRFGDNLCVDQFTNTKFTRSADLLYRVTKILRDTDFVDFRMRFVL